MNDQQRLTCAHALDKFGYEAQALQAIEECAELIVVLRHFSRHKAALENVVTEVADVAIMIEQLTQIVGREKVEDEIERKLKRLGKLVER